MLHIIRPDEELNAVSIRQMLLFEAAGRLGSVTVAAAACGLSQPASTQALQQYQERTGLDLFERGSKGLVLSEAGASLHEDVARILQALSRAFRLPQILDLWRLSPTHIRAFVAMYQRRSLENAAATLGITGRSIIRAVQGVEAVAGVGLLVEKATGRVLNAKGNGLARHCELFLSELDWAIAKAMKIQNGSRQIFRIGVTTDPGMAAIGNVVKDHLQRHPNSCIHIDEAAPQELLTRLVIGQVDMIFGYTDVALPDGVVWEQLYSSPFRVAAAVDHPLAGYANVSVTDLAQYDWVDANDGSQRHSALKMLFADENMPRCRLTCPAPPLAAQIIGSTTALGLMTDYELATRRDTLVVLAVATPGLEMRIACACREHGELNAAQVDLLNRTRHYFAAHSLADEASA